MKRKSLYSNRKKNNRRSELIYSPPNEDSSGAVEVEGWEKPEVHIEEEISQRIKPQLFSLELKSKHSLNSDIGPEQNGTKTKIAVRPNARIRFLAPGITGSSRSSAERGQAQIDKGEKLSERKLKIGSNRSSQPFTKAEDVEKILRYMLEKHPLDNK